MITFEKLTQLISKKIGIIDGGMGSQIQSYNLTAEDFGGEELAGCNDYLVITRPDVIKEIHTRYLEAGADIIETNTFGASAIVLEEYGLEEQTREINLQAARIARECTDAFENRFVAGSMGPTTKSLVVTGGASFEEMRQSYYQQALGLIEGGVHCLFVETIQDTLNTKAALQAIKDAEKELETRLPVFVSASIDQSGRMLAGQDIESFYHTVRPYNPFAIGMNCAVGPRDLSEPLSILNSISDIPLFIFPNAGLPNSLGAYDEDPEVFSSTIEQYGKTGLLNLAGGCCGTTPEHIQVLSNKIQHLSPRSAGDRSESFAVSGVEIVFPNEKIRPILVGERSNVQGSRKFRELIRGENYDEALEIIKSQVQSGAQIIDICLEDTESNEIEAMHALYPMVSRAIKAPVMIDSTDPLAVQTALRYCQGKSIINSINLESGTEKIEQLVGIIKKFGASAVVGLIDEQGMALTFERKMELADRLYHLLVDEYELSPQDLIFDLLVFTVDTGSDSTYKGTARATIDAIAAFKKKYPEVMTILGISNVSFGLPHAGREVLNSVFFYQCVQAGLDLAIVNPALLKRYNTIPEEEILLANRVIDEQSSEALSAFSNFFRDRSPGELVNLDSGMSADESMKSAIVIGMKSNVRRDLDTLLETMTPLEIINKVIMAGMAEVGDLFGEGKLIVTEVLQSAEVVKAAIDILEPLIPRTKTQSKKKILLATVKGDVHDIGKNLVRIIFESNGYEVVDLGTRVDSHTLISKIREYNPDAIGLSGLLVKSSRYMVTVAEELKNEAIDLPLLVGGAALTSKFTKREIGPAAMGSVHYARDAMSGLEILNSLFKKGDD